MQAFDENNKGKLFFIFLDLLLTFKLEKDNFFLNSFIGKLITEILNNVKIELVVDKLQNTYNDLNLGKLK